MKLSEEVKQKLSEAVELWCDDNLDGKPAIYALALYLTMEKKFMSECQKIEQRIVGNIDD
jgi:hypothetical protein